MTSGQRTTTAPSEAIAVVCICFGLFIVMSTHSFLSDAGNGHFSDVSFIWLVGVELVFATVALTFLHFRRYAVSSLYPVPTLKGCVAGVALFAIAWLMGWLMTAPFAVDQPDQPIEAMMRDASFSLPVLVTMAMVNGAYEEIFLLGFLLRGYGLSVALGVSLLVRVLYHLYQGPLGAVWVLGVGLVFSLYYIRSMQLWPPAFAHMLWDIVPFYLDA